MAIVDKPTDYFETKLWTGNGSSQNITGLDFQPDWVWIKSRTDTRKHNVYDSVRGVQKRIVPNSTVAEDTASGLTAFGTNGFTVGSETDTNGSGRNFVGWSWKAGGSASNNTDGSLTISLSANQDAGFSIATFTSSGSGIDTLGHGLGVAPSMIIIKSTTNANNWSIYHKSIGNNKEILFTTGAASTNTMWNNTTPTSTLWNLNTSNFSTNRGGVAYCFAEKNGFSKFGSYVGNGNADGTFTYTGFKPAFVLTKKSSGSAQWQILDNKRDTYNPQNTVLFPDSTDADTTGYNTDFLSNGFKQRATTGSRNGSGDTYIYMAFAENPFVTSTANGSIPATAR
jgi:hypothetical protein